jgi:glucose-6-phosphate isomerase
VYSGTRWVTDHEPKAANLLNRRHVAGDLQVKNLNAHGARLATADLRSIVESGPGRAKTLLVSAAGVEIDASKQRIDEEAWTALLDFAAKKGVEARRDALLAGDIVNETEHRPALHTAFRHGADIAGSPQAEFVEHSQAATRAFAHRVRSGDYAPGGKPIERVVNIGIGGSDLGPRLVADALQGAVTDALDVRFVASLDPTDLEQALVGCDPKAVLFIVASKSFSTQETLMTAQAARSWLSKHVADDQIGAHFAAASSARDKAVDFGLDPDLIFDFPDWIGGRYSVWCAVGLSIEIALGPDVFEELRSGAQAMDRHFATAPMAENLPIAKGLIDFWNRAVLGYPARCVAAYSARLGKLADFFQQLEMESLGKAVTRDGKPVTLPGGALVWGGSGTEIQHSFFQWLHQGQDVVPVDFVGIARHFASDDPRERALAANMAGQGAALLDGRKVDVSVEPKLAAHKSMPGGRGSSTILLDDLSASSLGALLALHEHKVFVESVLYDINPFDQWGVELGKVLMKGILDGDHSGYDASTRALLKRSGAPAV